MNGVHRGQLPSRKGLRVHRCTMRVLVVGAACAALSTVGVTGASASHASFRAILAAQEASRTQLSPGPGAQLWVERYGTTEFENTANAVKVSPGGGTVFVTGSTDPPSGGRRP